ncbi:hypothetical protein BHE74_00055639 [Ensete ventricosum]|uniref:Uncharacterized protein n=1 Tax=Ensete ventricosum TaxID=4639 RepID=A0A426ZX31_ENSVE|nr:hypothetical protein B296_00014060 [Ensete ventricosum]RWV77131.1 hypothetical protein GW17_00062087 [Ensete ventricosum]RWW39066.1 hypothetical protein BHE74_00055639 [Ensete ventricosum]RZS26353.1 hypothetical protein BHM03_00059685 [Ensete ventricosum]
MRCRRDPNIDTKTRRRSVFVSPLSPRPSPRFRVFGLLPRREMTNSRRLADRKIEKFQKNITKRGSVPETTVKKGNDYPVGPVVLGFFIFVVIGSCMPS